MMRFACYALLLLIFTTSCSSKFITINQLKDCDLLFHVPTTDNAITDVTTGIDNSRIDHVAIFFKDNSNGNKYNKNVIEAIEKGVVITSIDDFLSREGDVLVGRIKTLLDRKQSIENARQHLNKPYDYLYLENNDSIYCSELVLFSFVNHNEEKIFHPIPMTFRDANGNIPEYWTQLYKDHNMEVPEGKNGSNPAELSRRKEIKIKYLKQQLKQTP